MASGILNVNKAAGPSSFGVVRVVRRLPGITKAGHGGTLDPSAAGVLPILVNGATRLTEFIHDWPKTYLAEMILGFSSDTGDREGQIKSAGDARTVNAGQIEALLSRFVGRIEQVPPMHSALKQAGEALYRKARRGENVERQARSVEIFAIRLVEYVPARATGWLEVTSGRGMYVRSLIQDLGAALGCGAYLKGLTRTALGPLSLGAAVSLEALTAAGEGWTQWLLPMDLPLRHWPAMMLDARTAEAVRQGRPIEAPTGTLGRLRLLDREGRLLAWGEVDAARRVQPRAVFPS